MRVLIIGAGVSGLALAQGLKRRGIDFAVFERDAELDSRGQGYRLKVVGETVQNLKELVTEETWSEIEATNAETGSGETTINATDGSITACRRLRTPKNSQMPSLSVDRGMLRMALMAGIADRVQFGKALRSFDVSGDEVEAVFEDGSKVQGSLLVGADGAKSRVRKLFHSDLKIIDTGACCIYGKTPLSEELLQGYPKQCHDWMTVATDKTPVLQEIIFGNSPITMIADPVRFKARHSRKDLPDDYVHWGIMFPKMSLGLDEEQMNTALRESPAEISRQLTEMWHPAMRSILDLQDPAQTSGTGIMSVPMKINPWKSVRHVTIIGDAAHLMSPAGGVGATTAINDAWKLATILGNEGLSEESISTFESYMRSIAEKSLQRTYRAGVALQNQQPYDECKEVEL